MYVLIVVQQITCLNSLPGLCACTPSTSTVPRRSENGSSLEHGYSPPSTNTAMILKRASAVQASITGSTGASFQIFLPFSNGNFFAQLLQAQIRERNEKVCETHGLSTMGRQCTPFMSTHFSGRSILTTAERVGRDGRSTEIITILYCKVMPFFHFFEIWLLTPSTDSYTICKRAVYLLKQIL